MTLESFRGRAVRILDPIALLLKNNNITANYLSLLSLLFAVLGAVAFYYSMDRPWYLLLASLLVFLNSLTDALDGTLARITKTDGARGDFLDHVIDRYSDIFIICGIFFAGYVQWEIGVIAITGVLLTSYLGTQAQAVRVERYYGGIMGRADRLVLIILAGIANAFYPQKILYYSLLGWSIVVIAITSHITALQRIHHIWNRLKTENREQE